MDQPLTTVSAAADRAARTATEQSSPVGGATAALRGLGATRLAVLGAVALGLLGLLALLLLRVTEPHDALLDADLAPEYGIATIGRLAALGVSFRPQGYGRAVPDRCARVRPRKKGGGEVRSTTPFLDQQGALRTAAVPPTSTGRALEGERARISSSPTMLGDTTWPGRQLVRLGRGVVFGLNCDVGQSVDTLDNRLVSRGQVVLLEDRLGRSYRNHQDRAERPRRIKRG